MGIVMIEREIEFLSSDIRLRGTLSLPDESKKYPAALLIPGSGQVDRNENARHMPINIFGQMACFLAENGVACLRYDKRGIGESGGDFWQTGFLDNAADASAALDSLKQYGEIEPGRVVLLGHSEGALIATRLAASKTRIAGIILLAGAAQPGEDVLKWQAEQVVKGMKGFNAWLIRLLRIDVAKAQQKQLQMIKNSSRDSYRVQLFTRINAKWMRQFMAYNPADDLPAIEVPVLAITGSKDIQVDPENLERMARLVKSDFEYHMPENITHILRREEGPPSISTYRNQAGQPVDAGILNMVLDWLKRKIIAPFSGGYTSLFMAAEYE